MEFDDDLGTSSEADTSRSENSGWFDFHVAVRNDGSGSAEAVRVTLGIPEELNWPPNSHFYTESGAYTKQGPITAGVLGDTASIVFNPSSRISNRPKTGVIEVRVDWLTVDYNGSAEGVLPLWGGDLEVELGSFRPELEGAQIDPAPTVVAWMPWKVDAANMRSQRGVAKVTYEYPPMPNQAGIFPTVKVINLPQADVQWAGISDREATHFREIKAQFGIA